MIMKYKEGNCWCVCMCELTAILCTTGYLYFNRDSLLLNMCWFHISCEELIWRFFLKLLKGIFLFWSHDNSFSLCRSWAVITYGEFFYTECGIVRLWVCIMLILHVHYKCFVCSFVVEPAYVKSIALFSNSSVLTFLNFITPVYRCTQQDISR